MTYYYIRFNQRFKTIPEAVAARDRLTKLDLPHATIGYYIPQPQYKNWVPNWMIRLIKQ